MILFGYIKGMPYERAVESFNHYAQLRNEIPKDKVISHIESLDPWATSLPSTDMFTGEKLQSGQYHDGEFRFPREFLHYYKNYDIGIPYDYEAYLKTILS